MLFQIRKFTILFCMILGSSLQGAHNDLGKDHVISYGGNFGYLFEQEEYILGVDVAYSHYITGLTLSTMPKIYLGDQGESFAIEMELLRYLVVNFGPGIEYRWGDGFSYHFFIGLPIGDFVYPKGLFSFINFFYMEPYTKVCYKDEWFWEVGILIKVSSFF